MTPPHSVRALSPTNRPRRVVSPREMDPQRGSISPAIPVFFTALLIVIGLVVDGGAKINAATSAQWACQDAVRAAGQHISLVNGHITIDRSAAIAAGTQALSAAGVDGSMSINGTRITADASKTVPTTFLPLIGITQVTGSSTATSDVAVGVTTEAP